MKAMANLPSAVWPTLAGVAVAAAIVAITCRTTRGAGRAVAVSGASLATLCVGLGSPLAALAFGGLVAVTVGAMAALGNRTLYKQDVDPVAFRGVIVRASAWGASWLTLLFAARVLRARLDTAPEPIVGAHAFSWALPVVLMIAAAGVAAMGAYAIVRTHAGAAGKGPG